MNQIKILKLKKIIKDKNMDAVLDIDTNEILMTTKDGSHSTLITNDTELDNIISIFNNPPKWFKETNNE
jgi:hypothetical protein